MHKLALVLLAVALLDVALSFSTAATSGEVLLHVQGGGKVALSTRGPAAFRIRFLPPGSTHDPVDTPMVHPNEADADFKTLRDGISTAFGSVSLTSAGELKLFNTAGMLITSSLPLAPAPANDTCASQPGTDAVNPQRIDGDAVTTVASQAACCAACEAATGCNNWIFGHPGDAEGNCWLLKGISGTTPSPSRTLGGAGGGAGIKLSTSGAKLFGRGGGKSDAMTLTADSGQAFVDNTVVYAPHYYSTDGYACLAATDRTTGNGKTNVLPVSYSSDGEHITWSHPAQAAFDLYLMPAQTLDLGTAAYYSLIGMPAVPPRWAFGFIASRWGWENRSYIEYVLHNFRSGSFPIDAFIGDFGWFTDVSDYAFPPPGVSNYHDFGYNNATFPQPKAQLTDYADNLHIRMGGIRKPRLGNTDLLVEAAAKGYLLPGGERRQLTAAGEAQRPAEERATEIVDGGLYYADQRNLNYSNPAVREWDAGKQAHYLSDGVTFFWNDEGETDYYTFHWWNVAQADTLRAFDPTRRFYSINRAWSPGMARLGATVWTGDINPSWDDLRNTAGLVLNWGLGGAPYVACDIGGFTSESNGPLLSRWFQLGTFMPTMRVHSTKSATPHFPFLWPEPFRSTMKAALELRYRLIPYHYSAAHVMYSTGRLAVRALAAEFPDDDDASAISSQWLDDQLLVAPILTDDSQRNVYLPAGDWYAFGSSIVHTGPTKLGGTAPLSEVPVFVRPGAIVPLAPVIQYSDALPGGPLEVQVYAGVDGTFTLVEDDGQTLKYTVGSTRTTAFSWDEKSSTLTWTVGGGGAASPQMFTQLFVRWFGKQGQRASAVVAIGKLGAVKV